MNSEQSRIVTKYFVTSFRNDDFDLEKVFISKNRDVFVQYWSNGSTLIVGFDVYGDEIFYSHYCDLSESKLEELENCRSYIGEGEIFDLLDLTIKGV